jgi:hypothetical protein
MNTDTDMIPSERIERCIFLVRNTRVMLDHDLAALYRVTTKALVQAVKRNRGRFPEDFMFQLSAGEFRDLRSQFVTSTRGGRRYAPYAFTEQGVAMLSAVLRSAGAVAVSVEIMRVFVRLRRLLAANEQLARQIGQLEARLTGHDQKFAAVFDAIRQLIATDRAARRKPAIGYHTEGTRPPKT